MIIGAGLYYGEFSKGSKFEGVGCAVEVGFDYRGLACITMDFLKVLNLWVLVLRPRLALNVGAWLVLRRIFQKF